MNETEIEAFLDVYDDLAVEIVDDTRKNTEADLDFSNRELAENICRAMGWEDFDLLAFFDYPAVVKLDDPTVVLAHAFVSFLRWRLFSEATKRDIGDSRFNQSCTAYSEFWYINLVQRWTNLTGGPQMKAWLN